MEICNSSYKDKDSATNLYFFISPIDKIKIKD